MALHRCCKRNTVVKSVVVSSLYTFLWQRSAAVTLGSAFSLLSSNACWLRFEIGIAAFSHP